jgi:hypothetical protein
MKNLLATFLLCIYSLFCFECKLFCGSNSYFDSTTLQELLDDNIEITEEYLDSVAKDGYEKEFLKGRLEALKQVLSFVSYKEQEGTRIVENLIADEMEFLLYCLNRNELNTSLEIEQYWYHFGQYEMLKKVIYILNN